MDTTLKDCKICGKEFDRIPEHDNQICLDCKKDWKEDYVLDKKPCKVCGWWTHHLSSEKVCQDCYKDI